MRDKVIWRLVGRWKRVVFFGDFDKEEMRKSLEEQVYGGCQGWDSSLDGLEINPDLAEDMGYDVENMTDEQLAEWRDIVIEAAKKYLEVTK